MRVVAARLSARRERWASEPFRARVARLSVARMISETGTRASWIALVAVVYERSGDSGAWVSAALVAQFSAYALVMLVPESERAWATAARSSGAAAGIVLGGIVGGVVVAAVGGPATFLLDAASFLISALLVLSIRGRYRAERATDAAHAGALAGVRFIVRNPALRVLVGASGAAFVGLGMINVAEYPLFLKLGSNAVGFGVAVAGYGIGQLVGARLARRIDGAHGEKRWLLIGWAVGGGAILLCGLVPVVPILVILFAVAGFGGSSAGVATSLILQRWTPDPVRARVFAASSSVNIGAIGVAMIAAGGLIGLLAPSGVCVLCGVVTFLALGLGFRLPPRGRRPPFKPDGQATAEPVQRRVRWLLAT